MTSTESVFFWLTTLLLAASFFGSLLSLVFKKTAVFKTARMTILAAFLTLTVLGIIRWVGSSHPPFVTLFESMITATWFTLLIYLFLVRFSDRFSIILMPVTFITFLLMGWSSSLPPEYSPLSATLQNVWLFIHASFATSGAAAFLLASSFSILYLGGPDRLASYEKIAARVPEYKSLPKMIFNFVIFGLILWGVMIVSGSIWANAAWGRYWAWDPIELWSLISWLLYGLVLHSRLAFKVPRKIFCWMTIIAAVTIVFSLWGVGYVYETIHNYG